MSFMVSLNKTAIVTGAASGWGCCLRRTGLGSAAASSCATPMGKPWRRRPAESVTAMPVRLWTCCAT